MIYSTNEEDNTMDNGIFLLCMTIAAVGIMIFVELCDIAYELREMNESKKKAGINQVK